MALIILGAAKGAPGVTTTTAALAAVWPRPVVVVEADPAGSDLQVILLSAAGAPLRSGRQSAGLMGVAIGSVPVETLLDAPTAQDSDLGVPVVVGPPHSRSAHGMGAAWRHIASALAKLARTGDRDVLVDVGRLDDASPAMPLVQQADMVVLLGRRSVRGVVHTRTVAGMVEERMRDASRTARAAVGGLLFVDDPATSNSVPTQWHLAAKGLTRAWPEWGSIAHDPASARALFDPSSRQRDINPLMNSIRQAAATLVAQLPATIAPARELDSDDADENLLESSPSSTAAERQVGERSSSMAAASGSHVEDELEQVPAPPRRQWPPVPPNRGKELHPSSIAGQFGSDNARSEVRR